MEWKESIEGLFEVISRGYREHRERLKLAEDKRDFKILVFQDVEKKYCCEDSLIENVGITEEAFVFLLKRKLKDSEFDDLKCDLEVIFGHYNDLNFGIDIFSPMKKIKGGYRFVIYYDRLENIEKKNQRRNKLVKEYADETDIFK